jgi:dienelactone hydrolase
MKVTFKITLSLVLFILESSGIFPAQKTQLYMNLKPGVHSVGFKVVNETDFSRVYQISKTSMDIKKYSNGKPIQILIWYPAENERSIPKMTFEDYLALEIKEEFTHPPSEKVKKEHLEGLINYLSSIEKNGPAIVNLLKIQTLSRKNQKHKKGNFPLIIYGAGADGTAFENFIICEYLASFGYIVAACPSLGPHSHKMKLNSMGLEAQTRDLEYVCAFMSDFPFINQKKTAVMGWSWGGLAAVVMQMRNPNIDAVINLDGAISVHEDKAKQIPGFGLSKLRTTYLFMSAKAIQSNLAKVIKGIKYSKTYQINF